MLFCLVDIALQSLEIALVEGLDEVLMLKARLQEHEGLYKKNMGHFFIQDLDDSNAVCLREIGRYKLFLE